MIDFLTSALVWGATPGGQAATRGARRSEGVTPELQVWDRAEVMTFLPYAAQDCLHAACLPALPWGRRRGELVGLRYGQTETINVVTNYRGVPVRPGSMGLPIPGYVVDVCDDRG